MPVATKKLRAPAELESEESKAHEAGESPEDEVREGCEDTPRSRPSRKRGTKNARTTKAPMDTEGCSCSKHKRGDALSPQEYLDACALGIEHRGRTYIRARLDTAERLDKRCGKSGIPDNAKCSKGGGGGVGGALLGAAALAGAAGVGIAAHRAMQTKSENEARLARVNRLRNKGPAGRAAARQLVKQYAEATANSPSRDRREAKNRKRLPPGAEKVRRRTRRQGKVVYADSVFAHGFSVDALSL